MLNIRVTDLIRPSRAIIAIVSLFFLLPLLSGYGSLLFPETIQASPENISEIRSIGKVVAETEESAHWKNTTQVWNILVINTEAVSIDDAMTTTISRLNGQGWKVVANQSDWTQMRSPRWGYALLTLWPWQIYSRSQASISMRTTLDDAQFAPEALVVAEISIGG